MFVNIHTATEHTATKHKSSNNSAVNINISSLPYKESSDCMPSLWRVHYGWSLQVGSNTIMIVMVTPLHSRLV